MGSRADGKEKGRTRMGRDGKQGEGAGVRGGEVGEERGEEMEREGESQAK